MALRAKNNNNKTQKHTNKESIITCNAQVVKTPPPPPPLQNSVCTSHTNDTDMNLTCTWYTIFTQIKQKFIFFNFQHVFKTIRSRIPCTHELSKERWPEASWQGPVQWRWSLQEFHSLVCTPFEKSDTRVWKCKITVLITLIRTLIPQSSQCCCFRKQNLASWGMSK